MKAKATYTVYDKTVRDHVEDGGEIVEAYDIDFEYTNEEELNAFDVVRAINNNATWRYKFETSAYQALGGIIAKYGWAGKEDLQMAVRERAKNLTGVASIIQIVGLHFSFDRDVEPWRWSVSVTIRATFVPPRVT